MGKCKKYKCCKVQCYDPCNPCCPPCYEHKVRSSECNKLRVVRATGYMTHNAKTSVTAAVTAGSGKTFTSIANDGAGLFRLRGTFSSSYCGNPTVQLTPEYSGAGVLLGPSTNLNITTASYFEFTVDLTVNTSARVHITSVGAMNTFCC